MKKNEYKKVQKKQLIVGISSLFMCLAMFVGTTFAWFTDTASTNVNKIEAGTLQVELQMKNPANSDEWISAENQSLKFRDANGNDEVLWEPGASFNLDSFRIANKGNLALKYKIIINGISEQLLEAIKFTVSVEGSDLITKDGTSTVSTISDLNGFEGTLAADATTGSITIKGVMPQSTLNNYQGLTVNNISISITATQDTVEYDSDNNQYDKNAQYKGVAYSKASSQDDISNVLADPKDESGETTNKVAIDLNEGSYTVPAISGDKQVTITGDESTEINMGNSDIIGAQNDGLDLTVEGTKVSFNSSDTYKGITHSDKLTYKDCTITGMQTLYANEVEFINCTFEQTIDDQYMLWTYSAKNVTFTNCTFNSKSNSKAILCYVEGQQDETLTRKFKNCKFNATGTAEKSAIMINPTGNSEAINTYVINIDGCTATGYGTNGIDDQTIVGVKNTVKDNITVNINGSTVYTHSAS